MTAPDSLNAEEQNRKQGAPRGQKRPFRPREKSDFLFRSRNGCIDQLSTRKYHRIVDKWVEQIGLKVSDYGTHSLCRTKVVQLYRNTGNFRAVQRLLGHAKIDSTIRCLGIELEDALQISEALEI